MYKSDFTDDDEISNQKKLNSLARSNASMPLFSGNLIVFAFVHLSHTEFFNETD